MGVIAIWDLRAMILLDDGIGYARADIVSLERVHSRYRNWRAPALLQFSFPCPMQLMITRPRMPAFVGAWCGSTDASGRGDARGCMVAVAMDDVTHCSGWYVKFSERGGRSRCDRVRGRCS